MKLESLNNEELKKAIESSLVATEKKDERKKLQNKKKKNKKKKNRKMPKHKKDKLKIDMRDHTQDMIY